MIHVHQRNPKNSIQFKVIRVDAFRWIDILHLLQLFIGMLCYFCESPKENSECQLNPNQTTTTTCESKQHVCFTKKIQNVTGNGEKKREKNVRSDLVLVGKLVQFSRGCSIPPTSSTNNSTQQSQCQTNKSEGKIICTKFCQTNLCNTQDIRFVFNDQQKKKKNFNRIFSLSDGSTRLQTKPLTLLVSYLLSLIIVMIFNSPHC